MNVDCEEVDEDGENMAAKVNGVLKEIPQGHASDPPGTNFYYSLRLDKRGEPARDDHKRIVACAVLVVTRRNLREDLHLLLAVHVRASSVRLVEERSRILGILAKPAVSAEASRLVAEELVHFFRQYGPPAILQSDNGTEQSSR